MGLLRRLARRWLPRRLRAEVALARRHLLDLTADDDRVAAGFHAPVCHLPAVGIAVEQPPPEASTWSARTLPAVTPPGGEPRRDDLGWPVYRIPDAPLPRAARA